jgi:tetratricopeptide (TPR) repeat protein
MNYSQRLNTGIKLKREKKFNEALGIFLELLEECPQDTYLLANLGHLYFLMKDYESALKMLERACNIKPQGEFVLKLKADVLLKLNRAEEAEYVLQKILDKKFDLEIVKQLVKCYIQQSKFHDALQLITRAMNIIDYDRDLELMHGEILSQLNMYQEAEECFKRIISHNPEDNFAYLRLVMIKLKCKSNQEVINELKNILTIPSKRNNAYLHGLLAEAYQRMGMYKDALKEYKEALKLNPDNIFIRKHLGFCYSKLGTYDEVINMLRECIHISPDDPYVRSTLLAAYRKTNRLSEAKELLKELIIKYPNKKSFWGILKKIEKELNNR